MEEQNFTMLKTDEENTLEMIMRENDRTIDNDNVSFGKRSVRSIADLRETYMKNNYDGEIIDEYYKNPTVNTNNDISIVKETVDNPTTVEETVNNTATVEEPVDNIVTIEETFDNIATIEETVDNIVTIEETIDNTATVEKTVDNIATIEETVDNIATVEETIDNTTTVEETVDETKKLVKSSDKSFWKRPFDMIKNNIDIELAIAATVGIGAMTVFIKIIRSW